MAAFTAKTMSASKEIEGCLPDPLITKPMQLFVTLVDQFLAAKKKDPDADTSALERQIDEMVYELYGLTEKEIKIIENQR